VVLLSRGQQTVCCTIPQDPRVPDVPDFNPDYFDYRFRNDHGCLRVGLVRRHLNEEDFPLEKIVSAYKEWVAKDEWLQLLRTVSFADGSVRSEVIYAPCVKRGNPGYQKRINRKIAGMGDFSKKRLDAVGGRNNLKTRVLFITLTQDTKRFKGLWKYPAKRAWYCIGKEFNVWVNEIRRHFGKVAFFRVWEATEAGFPHVHLVMVFDKHEFQGFLHNGKLRIRGKKEFEKNWHSNVDVEGVVNFKRGMSEVLKYLKKGVSNEKKKQQAGSDHKCFLDSKKGGLTLALNWFFNKQQFAVSGFFSDLITDLHNNNMWIRIPRFFQSDLQNLPVVSVEYALLGIVPFNGGDEG